MSDPALRGQIEEILSAWRQGDCVLVEQAFVYRVTPEPARESAEGQADIAEVRVRGLMVASQSCDLVRSVEERPFVEVCPLVEVDAATLEEIRKARRPRYAWVPGVAGQLLVADLDRTMTIEKSVVASWQRTAGCGSDEETRALATALSRKRSRFAFPDDFVLAVRRLEERLREKHEKNSPEGRALRALREIRVRAAPSWDAERVELLFFFIREEEAIDFEGKSWDTYMKDWLDRISATERFDSVDGVVVTLDDLTARDYVESDRLDLDHLSLTPAARAHPVVDLRPSV
jgi:hypothetical protein